MNSSFGWYLKLWKLKTLMILTLWLHKGGDLSIYISIFNCMDPTPGEAKVLIYKIIMKKWINALEKKYNQFSSLKKQQFFYISSINKKI